MLSTRLSMHRPSLRHKPATLFACTGAFNGNVRGGQCGAQFGDSVKGYEWINLDFTSLDPGGGFST